jgi:hypothetical protein
MPISNVIGDVVKGAGNILGDIFSSSRTPTILSLIQVVMIFESIYSDPDSGNSSGDI